MKKLGFALLLLSSFSVHALFNHPIQNSPISNWYATPNAEKYIEASDLFQTGDVYTVKISFDLLAKAGQHVVFDYINVSLEGGAVVFPIPGTGKLEDNGQTVWWVAEYNVQPNSNYYINYGFSQWGTVEVSEVVSVVEMECGYYD